ncbi:MAG: DUF3370 family protein [Candidatus Sericytochromatia bacterium]|nr:DUF3370 family protein [Candidatus Sericytochromatia bacterium]
MSIRPNGSNKPAGLPPVPSGAPPAAPPPAASAPRAGDALTLTTGLNGVQPLPGGLDQVPVLNSNHPEIVYGPGVIVSTLPGAGASHLNYPFMGPFEVFTHHQNRSERDLFQALVLHNPGTAPVRVKVGPSAATITNQAPYRDHGPVPAPDPWGMRASGPGDKTAMDFLRGGRAIKADEVVLAPGETRVVHALRLPPGNEGTGAFRFTTEGPVNGAVVIEDAPPTAASVKRRLDAGDLMPRSSHDPIATQPGAPGQLIFGRVAGVQTGAAWRGSLTTDGEAFRVTDQADSKSWVLVGKRSNTLGTGQDQAAPLARRYGDTAYAAHGNYGVTYDLALPLRNDSQQPREVRLYFDSPGKPLPQLSRVFRGAIAIDVTDAAGRTRTEHVHVSQRAGEVATVPLTTIKLAPGEATSVRVRVVYPANSTPPHALRVETGEPLNAMQRLGDVLRGWFGF